MVRGCGVSIFSAVAPAAFTVLIIFGINAFPMTDFWDVFAIRKNISMLRSYFLLNSGVICVLTSKCCGKYLKLISCGRVLNLISNA